MPSRRSISPRAPRLQLARQRSASFTMRNLSAALNTRRRRLPTVSRVASSPSGPRGWRSLCGGPLRAESRNGFGTICRPFSAHCYLDYQGELSQTTLAFWVTFIRANPGLTGMRTAIQHALAESPDRLVVGDLRDSAASDIVAAWRLPPRRGGLAIVYANGTRGTLEEFASLASQSRYPVGRGAVADAVDICVHLVRDKDTTAGWRLSALDAVTGYDVERREWLLEPLG